MSTSDPRDRERVGDDETDSENLQTSTGGGMGPESYPPDDDEDLSGNGGFSGNGAGRGPG
jgi:hypothetical protein